MLKKTALTVIFVALLVRPVLAAGDGFGLGVIAGEPTGISGKLWLTQNTAIDGAAAWSFGNSQDAFHVHGDYLLHNASLFKVDQGDLSLHFGVGGRIKFADDTLVGIRVPVGLTYLFENATVDLFVEVVPILDLVDSTDLNLNAALGVRYFFGHSKY